MYLINRSMRTPTFKLVSFIAKFLPESEHIFSRVTFERAVMTKLSLEEL